MPKTVRVVWNKIKALAQLGNLKEHDLQDVTEATDAPQPGYTNWQGECHSHLYRVYLSSELTWSAHFYCAQLVAFSDQAPVEERFGRTEPTKHDLYRQSWKLIESFLEDDNIPKDVKKHTIKLVERQARNAANLELLKAGTIMKLISVGQKKANRERAENNFWRGPWRHLFLPEMRHPVRLAMT